MSAATPSETELETLRNRIRHQVRSNALAAAGAETRAINIVTHKLQPQSQVRADDPDRIAPRFRGAVITEEMAERFRAQVEAAWPIFAKWADPTGELEMEDLTYIAGRGTFAVDGEMLMHKFGLPVDGERQFHLAFEPVEVDRLKTPGRLASDPKVKRGVQVDGNGKPVLFHILKTHPAEGWGFLASDYYEIPGADIRHLFRHKRPSQRRGVPDAATVLQSMRDYKDLQDATVLKAQHSASMTAIMTTESPGDVETEFKHDESEDKEDKTWNTVTMPTGQLMLVPPTDQIHEFKSDHPSQTYESFVKGVKGDAAVGQQMSRLSLTKEGEGVNYSSMRGLYLQDRMVFLFDRSLLKRRWLQWAWECFCDECVLAGWAEAPFYMARRHAYTRVSWQFGPWGWVDPVKEVTAHALAVEKNIKSLPEVVQSEGGDMEDVIRANLRAEKFELEERERLGLPAKSAPPKPAEDAEGGFGTKALLDIANAFEEADREEGGNGTGPKWKGKRRF